MLWRQVFSELYIILFINIPTSDVFVSFIAVDIVFI